jgi:hypothetical protein
MLSRSICRFCTIHFTQIDSGYVQPSREVNSRGLKDERRRRFNDTMGLGGGEGCIQHFGWEGGLKGGDH